MAIKDTDGIYLSIYLVDQVMLLAFIMGWPYDCKHNAMFQAKQLFCFNFINIQMYLVQKYKKKSNQYTNIDAKGASTLTDKDRGCT